MSGDGKRQLQPTVYVYFTIWWILAKTMKLATDVFLFAWPNTSLLRTGSVIFSNIAVIEMMLMLKPNSDP